MRLRPAFLLLIALPLAAQEPKPARLTPNSLATAEGTQLAFAWRYAPGDDPARALTQYDDSHWAAVSPDLPSLPRGWTGIGWFRRHIIVTPSIAARRVKVTFEAAGAGDLYLDGSLVASTGRSASPMIPADRRESSVVTFGGGAHVLAVRYAYPPNAARAPKGFGFLITVAPPLPPSVPESRDWLVAAHGALVALPVFLAFLHFALFGFDRRAKENAFYGGEMLVFAVVIFHEYLQDFVTSDALRRSLDRALAGAPIVAILLGMLTYYAVRMNRLPRSWIVFAAIGAVLLAVSYGGGAHYVWIVYFGVMLVEIVRVERSGATCHRSGTAIFLASFSLFGIAIVLQVLLTFDVLQSVFGSQQPYVFGVVAFALGMSLYLAYNLGRSRMIELENERKTEELARARRLQLSMLPAELPRVEGLDVAVATQTAAEVGGDYYDVRHDGNGSLLVAFGDATGHGLASGILVTVAKALFTSLPADGSLASNLAQFDHTLREMRPPEFLRMCMSLARVSPHEASVASAAMPPLLVRRASDGSVVELGRGDVPLGSRFRPRYQERRMDLRSGDTILFASDGFAEQSRRDGAQFGYDGVVAALRDAGSARDAKSVLDRLFAAAQEFRADEALQDDMTLLVVRVT